MKTHRSGGGESCVFATNPPYWWRKLESESGGFAALYSPTGPVAETRCSHLPVSESVRNPPLVGD